MPLDAGALKGMEKGSLQLLSVAPALGELHRGHPSPFTLQEILQALRIVQLLVGRTSPAQLSASYVFPLSPGFPPQEGWKQRIKQGLALGHVKREGACEDIQLPSLT